MIKAIIFDLWRTLLTNGERKKMKKLGGEELEQKLNLFNFDYVNFIKYGQQTWMKDGKGIAEHYFPDYCYIMNIDKKYVPVLEELWQKAFEKVWTINGMLKLVKKLKENYKIGLISNAGLKMKKIFESKNISKLFDEKMYSFEEYLIKPNPNIYCRMLKKLGATPFQAVFIDDMQRFVDGSRYLGIDSILFKGAKNLKEELIKREIKI